MFVRDNFASSSFSNQLRLLRNRKNLKQKDIAEALGVSQSTIANYEQGIRFPDEETLKNLVFFLGVTSDELLGLPRTSGKQPGTPPPELRELREDYRRLIREGRFDRALEILIEGFLRGIPVVEIFGKIIEPVLIEIGTQWEGGEITAVREHLYTEKIRGHIEMVAYNAPKNRAKGIRCAAAAVGGEMHTLGLLMISNLLELEGFEVFYLGTNTPAPELVRLCIDESIRILALSVTMDYHINALSSLIDAVRSEPALRTLKILAGGSAVNRNPEVWKTSGADGYATGIDSILEEIRRVLAKGNRLSSV